IGELAQQGPARRGLESARLIDSRCGAPERQLSGGENVGVRSEDLLRKRGAGAQHPDDEYRTRRFARTNPRLLEPIWILRLGYQIDDLGQLPPVMSRPAQFHELVCAFEIDECLFEILHVIEVFPD